MCRSSSSKAAIDTKVANKTIENWETYKAELRKRVERVRKTILAVIFSVDEKNIKYIL